MPSADSAVAFAAVLSTVSIASADCRKGGYALGLEAPFLKSPAMSMGLEEFSPKPHAAVAPTMLGRAGLGRGIMSFAEPPLRGMTSLAFVYLAYKEYGRAATGSDVDESAGRAASWRWKGWSLCGATGLAVGPYGPYRGLLIRPLEQRLRTAAHLSDARAAQRLLAKWGRVTVIRGIILLGCVPFCFRAMNI